MYINTRSTWSLRSRYLHPDKTFLSFAPSTQHVLTTTVFRYYPVISTVDQAFFSLCSTTDVDRPIALAWSHSLWSGLSTVGTYARPNQQPHRNIYMYSKIGVQGLYQIHCRAIPQLRLSIFPSFKCYKATGVKTYT